METKGIASAFLEKVEGSASEIFENAPCGYLFSDLNGTIVKINHTLCVLTGYTREEIQTVKRFRDLLTVGSKIYYETNFDPLLRMQGFLNEVALDLMTKQRKPLPVLVNSTAIKNDKNETLGFQTTLFNISDRRAYERELLNAKKKSEESELRFKFLASAGKLLQGTHDSRTGFIDLTKIAVSDFCDACAIDLVAGPKMERVAEAYRGQGKIIPPVEASFMPSALNSIRRIYDVNANSRTENETILPWLKAFQEFYPESIITIPILLFGTPVGLISFLMLELGRKFSEADEALAIEISRRLSLAIEASRLETEKNESLRSLKEERDAREKFVATLTHDLRSPMTSIKMGAQMIMLKAETEQMKQIALRVIKGVDRADTMIQDLLDANSLRAGESIPLKFAECELRSEIDETVADLNHTTNRFVLEADGPIKMVASAQGVRRVVENLCNNAVKYGSPDTRILVTLRDAGSAAIITVHNFGNPISVHDQGTIFDLYKRTDSATIGGQKGWGLGLALVKGVATAHSGDAFVSSDSHNGTTFTVRLPKEMPVA